MVSFEMESETDLSNLKEVGLAQVTLEIFFSKSEALDYNSNLF